MSALTNYLENEVIDHLFRNRSFTSPTTFWIALHTADPTETGAVGEVAVANGYGRKQYNPGATQFEGTGAETTAVDSAGTGGHTQNIGVITFNAPSGAGWGTVSHFSIWDAETSGNCLIYGQLSASKTINGSDPAPYFAAGDLDFTLA